MITLGVSLYPEQERIEEIDKYLKMASKYGFTKVFTSMFSVPGTKEEIVDYFKKLCEIAHGYGMKVSGDCNTEFLCKIGANEKDLSIFKEMGIDTIRMDCCYMDHRDVELINNNQGISIELNAAMVQGIDLALKNGANPKNFSACHNFYPERYTGADLESIQAVNKELKKLGIRCAIFISSNEEDGHGPWPVQNGLPTLEDHRCIPAELQVRHLIALGDVDEILFGNAFASENEFKQIYEVMQKAFVNIPINESLGMIAHFLPHGDIVQVPFRVELENDVSDLEKEILFDYPTHSAGEYVYYMIRSRWTRIVYGKQSIPARKSDKEYYEPGDVVIVNDNLKHYRGEVQIVLKEMKVDGQRNLLGHIRSEDKILLKEVKPGDSICFLK